MIGQTRWRIWGVAGIVVGIIILLLLTAKWMRTDEPLSDTAKKFM